MKRVGTQMNPDNFRHHIMKQESLLNKSQNNLGTQTRFQKLREDPAGIASSVRLDSYLTRLNQFSKNSALAQSNLRMKESYMNESLNILNRLRELSIAGSSGTYSESDMKAMGIETNELLEELLSIANAKGNDQKSLFSGTRLNTDAFTATKSKVIDGYKEIINFVEYQGDIFDRKFEVADTRYVSDDLVGNKVFWAQNQKIETSINAENYIAPNRSQFTIDGITIDVNEGDRIYDIIDKINDSGVSVRASLDSVSKNLIFETTVPHQIWFDENIQNSTILRDLGVLSSLDASTPFNYHQNLKVQGGSVFDVIIKMRDSFLANNHSSLGSSDLQGISLSLDNILNNITNLGAKDTRLERTMERIENQIPITKGQWSQEIGLDITDALVEFNTLNTARNAILGTQGKLSQTSLLDFIR